MNYEIEQLQLDDEEKEKRVTEYKKNLPTILTNNQLQNLEEFENSLPFPFYSLLLHLQVVLFYINVRYETYRVGPNSLSASLFLPLISRDAERAFSDWDRMYKKNNTTSSAFMKRCLFLSLFSYEEILEALNAVTLTQSIAIFVEKLRTRPKRKTTDVIVWKKQNQLCLEHNNQFFQTKALEKLGFPPRPNKKALFSFFRKYSIDLPYSQQKNILLHPLRLITLLFAHKMKLVCFPSVILPHLHKQIQQLQQQQQQQRPQQQHHPLYRIVSASTEDLKKDDFRKSLTNLQGNQMLTMATDGNSRIGVMGDEMGVDIGKEGGGDKKGQKKRKRKREEDEIEWEIEKVLQWKGKKKEYGFIWEGARYRNVLYFYTREDLQQALEKVVEFWSCVCKDCWHEC